MVCGRPGSDRASQTIGPRGSTPTTGRPVRRAAASRLSSRASPTTRGPAAGSSGPSHDGQRLHPLRAVGRRHLDIGGHQPRRVEPVLQGLDAGGEVVQRMPSRLEPVARERRDGGVGGGAGVGGQDLGQDGGDVAGKPAPDAGRPAALPEVVGQAGPGQSRGRRIVVGTFEPSHGVVEAPFQASLRAQAVEGGQDGGLLGTEASSGGRTLVAGGAPSGRRCPRRRLGPPNHPPRTYSAPPRTRRRRPVCSRGLAPRSTTSSRNRV